MRRRCLNKVDANTLIMLHAEDFTDSSMNNYPIIVNNTTIIEYGKFYKCFDLSGSGYQLRIPSSPFNFVEDDFTFDFWLKLKSSSPGEDKILVNTGTVNILCLLHLFIGLIFLYYILN